MKYAISMVAKADSTRTRHADAIAILHAIRDGRWQKQVENIRRKFRAVLALTHDLKKAKEAIASEKKQLPAIMFSGTFSRRANTALVKHSGLVCAEFDNLNTDLSIVRQQLSDNPYVLAHFLSPSGDGVKFLVEVPADPARHDDSFRAIQQEFLRLTGREIDGSGKDVARLCFASFDPDLYVNENAKEIEPLPPEPKREVQSNVAADLGVRQRVAVELLGAIEWDSDSHGFLSCPAKHLHTTGDAKRDCEIYLDGAPTLHCLHDHCHGSLDGLNHELRSRIGKAEFVAAETVENREGVKSSDSSVATSKTDQGQASDDETIRRDDDTIRRLAKMSLLEYERVRAAEAKNLGCRASMLDRLVSAMRQLANPATDTLQGAAVKLADVEPWEHPVDGAQVLDEIAKRTASYVVMPPGAADVTALWDAHTHCFSVFMHSPRLNASSAEKQSGKTTLRDVCAEFVARPLLTENTTSAVLFRLVHAQAPTLLADEYDSWLAENEELRGLLNAGHRRGAIVHRCEGEGFEVRGFLVFAPVMLCGIGALPGTLHDRSIPIRLPRAKRGEIQARFDSRHVEVENELRRKLARFVADNRERIAACEPQMPETMFNRVADNWRPLFAIAEIAGGDWPQRCADAYTKLIESEFEDVETLRVALLTDIQQIFAGTVPPQDDDEDEEPEPIERIFSKNLCEKLAEMSERPWSEVRKGKGISERWLAHALSAFGIKSKTLRIGEDRAKGYEAAAFADAFERYVASTPLSKRDNVTTSHKSIDFEDDTKEREQKSCVTNDANVTDEKTDAPQLKTFSSNDLVEPRHGVTDKTHAKSANEASEEYFEL